MVSMKDISKRCGVSIATVSKALNGHSDIGEATRQRVLETAKEMGYYPNSSARALKTNRTYNLGVLFVDEAHNGLRHDYFANVLNSFKLAAESKGYDLTFINCDKTHNSMSYLEHSRYRGVDGVVVACVNFSEKEVLELIQSEIPVVTIDHVFNNRVAVCSNNIKGISDLIHYIYEMGHRRIAYIHGADSAVTRNRVSSFYRTMEELGLTVDDELVVQGEYRKADLAAEQTKKLLSLPDRPTCILYPDDYACIGGINMIKEMGLSIPEDISVVGFDGIDIAKILDPHITTLEQDTASMGRYAAEKLIELIEKPKTTLIESVIVDGIVLEGSSVADISK